MKRFTYLCLMVVACWGVNHLAAREASAGGPGYCDCRNGGKPRNNCGEFEGRITPRSDKVVWIAVNRESFKEVSAGILHDGISDAIEQMAVRAARRWYEESSAALPYPLLGRRDEDIDAVDIEIVMMDDEDDAPAKARQRPGIEVTFGANACRISLNWKGSLAWVYLTHETELFPDLLHELGHCYGLTHSTAVDSIMSYCSKPRTHLHSDDIRRVEEQYGAREPHYLYWSVQERLTPGTGQTSPDVLFSGPIATGLASRSDAAMAFVGWPRRGTGDGDLVFSYLNTKNEVQLAAYQQTGGTGLRNWTDSNRMRTGTVLRDQRNPGTTPHRSFSRPALVPGRDGFAVVFTAGHDEYDELTRTDPAQEFHIRPLVFVSGLDFDGDKLVATANYSSHAIRNGSRSNEGLPQFVQAFGAPSAVRAILGSMDRVLVAYRSQKDRINILASKTPDPRSEADWEHVFPEDAAFICRTDPILRCNSKLTTPGRRTTCAVICVRENGPTEGDFLGKTGVPSTTSYRGQHISMLQLEERFGILQPVKNTWLYASSGGVEHPLETMHGVGATYDLGDVTQACRANPLRFDCFTYRLWEDTGNWLVANPRLPGLFIDTTIDYFALNPNRWYPVGANGGSIGRDRLKATDWMVRGSVEMTSVLAQFHYIGELLPDYIGVASWRY